MTVTPKVVRRLRGRTSAIDLDTESGRAFLQERVAFFNKVAFLISGSFFVAAALFGAYYGDPKPLLLHAATLVVSLAAWQFCARGPGLSTGLPRGSPERTGLSGAARPGALESEAPSSVTRSGALRWGRGGRPWPRATGRR